MQAWILAIKAHPETLRAFLIGVFGLTSIILFLVAVKFKWLTSFSFSKSGIEIKQAEKRFQSGTINKLLDDQIHKLEMEMISFAIEKANDLKRSLIRQLVQEIQCSSTRRALVSALRIPIYEYARSSNFKGELKPDNIKYFVRRVMKDVAAEYEDFMIDHTGAKCPVTNEKCMDVPPLCEVMKDLENNIMQNWALPLRRKQVDICEAKIKLYRQFINSYTELGDQVRIKVTEHCIEKNKNYIAALIRKPELGET